MILAPPGGATDEQRAAIEHRSGNAYVGAGPGTGKTYLLVERYRVLRERGVRPGQILVLTFSRRAAGELTERLRGAGYSPAEIDVRTFHGFAARVIGGGTALFRSGRLLDGCSRRILLDAAIAHTPTPAFTEPIRASRGFRDELELVLADIGRAPDRALDDIAADASPRLRDVLAIARWCRAAQKAIGATDIGDLVGRAVAETAQTTSAASRWLANRYAHVLVDEFQDIDRLQLALLERLTALGAALFAVGDEAQSIYRFRGAGNDIVARAQRRFAMQRFDLTQSRRCPPDVCVLASQAPIDGLRALHSAHPSGAPVELLRLRAVDDEVAAIADAIESDLDAGLPAEQIAVLVRGFRPLGPLLVGELHRRSIAVAAIGREELLADPRIGTLLAGLEVLGRPDDPSRWARLLGAQPLRFDPIRIRFTAARPDSLRLDESLSAALAETCGDGALTADQLAAALRHAAQAWQADDLGAAARRLVRGLRLIAAVLNDEPPAGVRAAAARLKLVCDALAAAQRTATGLNVPPHCADLLARVDDLLPALALDDAGLDVNAPGVRILTVHAAKGLEFERVFVADAVAGRFPQERAATTLLQQSDRELLARVGCDGPSVVSEAAVHEEASLWYVALTRCKRRLTISYADRDLSGELQRPSRFIPTDRRPPTTSWVDRESLAMRALRSANPALREAVSACAASQAAPALGDYARIGGSAFSPLAGHPLQQRGSLGVSDAELWLQCPRRLFYKHFVRLRDDESAALVLGSTLHTVLERFHDVHASFSGAAIDVNRWTDDLLALFETHHANERYASPVLARAAATAAEVALRSYARALADRARRQPFTIEAREQPIAVRAGQYTLGGRADRIDRFADGTRAVVDYKLGAAKAEKLSKAAEKIAAAWRQADAAGDPREPLVGRLPRELRLQLGFYATAVESVTEVAYVYLGGESATHKRNGAVYTTEPFEQSFRAIATAALDEIASGLLGPLECRTLRSFSVTSNDEACTYCPYRTICPGAKDRDA